MEQPLLVVRDAMTRRARWMTEKHSSTACNQSLKFCGVEIYWVAISSRLEDRLCSYHSNYIAPLVPAQLWIVPSLAELRSTALGRESWDLVELTIHTDCEFCLTPWTWHQPLKPPKLQISPRGTLHKGQRKPRKTKWNYALFRWVQFVSGNTELLMILRLFFF